ncbi:hypothetical protein Fot_29002 [Forsythia ovata]|uniref:Uncharacterized protein n=1 Tax=Forsythia ovata TaxID=205694 RepID=A0ABD1TQM5_9LAMI
MDFVLKAQSIANTLSLSHKRLKVANCPGAEQKIINSIYASETIKRSAQATTTTYMKVIRAEELIPTTTIFSGIIILNNSCSSAWTLVQKHKMKKSLLEFREKERAIKIFLLLSLYWETINNPKSRMERKLIDVIRNNFKNIGLEDDD